MQNTGTALPTPLAAPLEGDLPLVELAPAFLDLPYPALLDSAATDSPSARYSYLAADPFLVLKSRGRQVTLETARGRRVLQQDPWQALRSLLERHRVARLPGLPPFQGGAIGYWAYDLGRTLERIPERASDDSAVPDMCLGLYDWCLAQDRLAGTTHLVVSPLPGAPEGVARSRWEWAMRRLASLPGNGSGPAHPAPPPSSPPRSNFGRDEYLWAVRRVKEYLAAGDIYQANISQRFDLPFRGDDPWGLYLALRGANPAPFAAYLSSPEATVLSASPELFLELHGDRVTTRPIKGTRPRGSTPREDLDLARELRRSEKDRAENVMIVDLLRNDLGKVCTVGSVEVPALFELERHPTVWHLVSTVTGALPRGSSGVDLLRACFPGGSVTGAPKLRAMEIIEELEPTRRGVYCGSIGHMAFNGDMCASIAIRTMVVSGGRLTFQVGGAVVADSDPALEFEETLHKAAGMMRALGHRA